MGREVKKEEISDSDNLLRRVLFAHPNFIKPDGTIASSCFKLKQDEAGLSVEIERLTSYEKSIQDKSRFRLYSINAGFIRSIELIPVHDPLPDNYAHALITGNITKGKSRQLAKKARRIQYPE